MFLVYLSQNLHAPFFYTSMTLRRLFSGESSCQKEIMPKMPKRKTMTVAITPTQKKSRGYLILDQKLRKNLKR